MSKKNFLYPSLLACAGLALAYKALAGRSNRVKAAPKASQGRTYLDQLDHYVEQQRKRLNIPGAALVVVEGDQIVHRRGFGQARPGGLPPTSRTPFSIGSVTKSFTALAVMQLVEAGKIELDAPLTCYLPWFMTLPPKERTAGLQPLPPITIRHLLNQTSGLPLLPGWETLADCDDRPGAVERQLRALSPVRLSSPAGDRFEYSNLNYNLLGLVIEAASGEPYAAYIQRHIFDPLRMDHSYTCVNAARQDGMAVGHQSWFGIPVAVPELPVPTGSMPSGQLISCAEDMGRYLMAHLNGGRCGEARILSPQGIAALFEPALETPMLSGKQGRYGMGWYISELESQRVIEHSGLVPDFFAFMVILPEQKRGLVLLVNMDHFTMQMTMADVDSGLTNLLAGQPAASPRFGALLWIQRALALVPLLQTLDVALTLKLVHRWRKEPRSRPGRGRLWRQHILLPLLPNLLLSLSLIPVMSRTRGFLMLFAPDFSWIARVCGAFAAGWFLLRTLLVLDAAG